MAKNDFDFQISKTKINKPKLMGVMVQLPEIQHAHLSLHCDKNDVSIAEFCRQAIAYILRRSKNPFPEVGEPISDELKDYIKELRKAAAKRAAKKARRSGDDIEENETEVDETEAEEVEATEEE